MKSINPAAVDRLLHPFVATSVLLGVLLVWQHTHQQSCVALASPAFVYIAIAYGLFAYRQERKRFALDYYLRRRSSWRRRFRGWWISAVISALAALPLAVFLLVFVALARWTDWFFLASAALVAPVLLVGLSRWLGRHLRRDRDGEGLRVSVGGILTARLAGWILLGLVAIAYVYFNYMRISGPWYIYPDSIERTVEAFTGGVHSACPWVDGTLRAAAAVEGASWYLVTAAATTEWIPEGIKVVVWIAFFLNAVLAITGFVRGMEGTFMATCQLTSSTHSSPSPVSKE